MSSTHALVLAVLAPALLGPFLFAGERLRRLARGVAPWAALPALVLALLPLPYPAIRLEWVLLGATFELDLVGRAFLIVAAALWFAAGIFADDYIATDESRRFFAFHLLTMTGNLGLIIAADAISFYFFFSAMTFAAYGLIVHRRHTEARRAGKVYLVMAVIGEACLLAGLLIASYAAGSVEAAAIRSSLGYAPSAGLVAGLLLVGFGIKAGAVPLHVWLPLAHPIAPTPASAVLSGSMIKAGLLGWIRFLPLGEVGLVGWGTFVVGIGIAAAFFGVVIGILQTEPKTVLAYSSISQMGLMNVGVGIALASPEALAPAVAAITIYAAHHGLAKAALFLGVGVLPLARRGTRARTVVAAGMFVAALAVAGAPLTSGGVAKGELKALLPFSPGPWPLWLEGLLPLSAFASTLLMARFLYLAVSLPTTPEEGPARSRWAPWAALTMAVLVALWILPRTYPLEGARGPYLPGIPALGMEILPLAAGGILVWAILMRGHAERPGDAAPRIAPGDLIVPIERLLARLPRLGLEAERGGDPVLSFARRWYHVYASSHRHDLMLRFELALTSWGTATSLVVLLLAALLAALLVGR